MGKRSRGNGPGNVSAPQKAEGRVDQQRAAAYIGIPERSLESMRFRGNGPPYYKIGHRVVYDTGDLDVWLAARRVTSTSDSGRASGPRDQSRSRQAA